MTKNDYRKEIIFGIILFAAFFTPYIKLGPFSYSGYEIADGAKGIFDLDNLFDAKMPDEVKFLVYKAYSLYLIPILSGLTVIFSLLDINPKFTSAIAGSYILFGFIYCLFTFDKFWNLTGIGIYLTVISGGILLVFSLQSSDQSQNSHVQINENNPPIDTNTTFKKESDNTSKKSIQEWRDQNPHKSLNDYYKEFGY